MSLSSFHIISFLPLDISIIIIIIVIIIIIISVLHRTSQGKAIFNGEMSENW